MIIRTKVITFCYLCPVTYEEVTSQPQADRFGAALFLVAIRVPPAL
jgi:hypothetical protein